MSGMWSHDPGTGRSDIDGLILALLIAAIVLGLVAALIGGLR